MFRAASDDDIEAYSDTVTCFIRKCIEDVVPTKTIRIYPNQKPWINSDVRSALSARTSAFKSGNTDDRKQASYDLRRSIKAAKRQYKSKVEEQFNNNNPRSMWQGINNITGFKGNKPATVNIAASLPDELNTFYARFEADNTAHTENAPAVAAEEVSPLSLSVTDVTQSFKRVNIRKAMGPDGIPGRVLNACAFQLAGGFTDIFNLFLSLSVVPACFNKSTIVPIPKKNKITCLNDWRPIALTPIFSKCFEKLVREHICSVLPASLDPLQFAYRSNRSTDDAIAFSLHTALSHLENKNTYVRMLFVDYSSAFNTTLNIDKTKELVVDYRRQSREHTHITIDKTPVERVNSFKFLGVHITEDLTWSAHTDAVLKKAHQRLFFLRRLRKFGMSPSILRSFYTCTVESILTGCITAWFGNSTAGNRRALQRVVRTARHVVGGELPSLRTSTPGGVQGKPRGLSKTPATRPTDCSLCCPQGDVSAASDPALADMRDSFFPQAIRLMNSQK